MFRFFAFALLFVWAAALLFGGVWALDAIGELPTLPGAGFVASALSAGGVCFGALASFFGVFFVRELREVRA